MNYIWKINSIWWIRIILFVLLTLGINKILEIFLTPDYYNTNIYTFISLLLSSCIIEAFRKNSRFSLFGLNVDKSMIKEIIKGIIIIIASICLVLFLSCIYQAEILYHGFYTDNVIKILTLQIFFYSAVEELIFRGVIFQALFDKISPYVSVVVFSIIFTTLHLTNPYINTIAIINIFLASVLMYLMYIQSQSLWLPITYHFLWNWSCAFLLGSKVSGYEYDFYIIKILYPKTHISELVFGNNFGIESGLITTVILVFTIAYIVKYLKPSVYITSLLFKRKIAESELLSNFSYQHTSNTKK